MKININPEAAAADATVDRIWRSLGDLDPEVHGAVLAMLLARYLSCLPDYVREEMLDHHIGLVRELGDLDQDLDQFEG